MASETSNAIKQKVGARNIYAVVNPSSGGMRGSIILSSLRQKLSPETVFDLSEERSNGGSLMAQLRKWAAIEADSNIEGKTKCDNAIPALLVCGGDGTVSWITTVLQECEHLADFAIATVPLGTANDWSRVFGWSNAFFDNIEKDALDRLYGLKDEVEERNFDVWKLRKYEHSADKPSSFQVFGKPLSSLPVLNYFSVGFDAKVAREFGQARESGCCCTGSRLGNICCYLGVGIKNSWFSCGHGSPNLRRLGVQLELDGHSIPIPCCATQITAINVPSYANGCKPWDGNGLFCCSKFQSGQVDDGYIEVFAIFGPQHMAMIGTRQVAAVRLGKSRKVEITMSGDAAARHGANRLCFQYDGEAQGFLIGNNGIKFVVEKHHTAKVLYVPARSGACRSAPSRAQFAEIGNRASCDNPEECRRP